MRHLTLYARAKALGRWFGAYRSAVRGQGLEYSELRPYLPGDDPKAFAWSKFAQLREPYTKTFVEERDCTLLILLDISGSLFWPGSSKSALALDVATLLILAAAAERDRVGLVTFSDDIEHIYTPHRGMEHAGRVIEYCRSITTIPRLTRLATVFTRVDALRGLKRALPKRALLCIISDYISSDSWHEPLCVLSATNDCIAIVCHDTWDQEPPLRGWVVAADAEGGPPSLCHIEPPHLAPVIPCAETLHLEPTADPCAALISFFQRRRHARR